MPILIRELVIKARVEPEAVRPSAAPKGEKADCGCGGAVSAEELARLLADRQER
jgi:hypothetical protein